MKTWKIIRNISIAVFAVFLVATVILNIAVRSKSLDELDYSEVNVLVIQKKESFKNGQRRVAVTVRYDGEEYKLKNVMNDYLYSEGSVIDAYLFNGEIYENTNSLKSETPLGTLYFVSLAISAISGTALLMSALTVADMKKKGKS